MQIYTPPNKRRRKLKKRSPSLFPKNFEGLFNACSGATYLISVLLFFCLMGYYVFLHFQPIKSEVTVNNNILLSREDILQFSNFKEPRSFFSADPYSLTRELSRNHWLKFARVRRLPPRRLVVYVEERTPIAFLKTQSQFFLIDEDQILLEPLKTEKSWDLPVIVDEHFQDELDAGNIYQSGTLIKAFELLKLLLSSDILPLQSVSEIVITDPVNIVLVTMPNNIRINVGLEDFEKKLLNLEYGMEEIGKRRKSIKMLDLRYKNKIVVEM